MRTLPRCLLLISLLVGIGACSDDDGPAEPTGPTGDPDLLVMADCVEFGIAHLGLAVDATRILFHRLDEMEAYTPPSGFGFNPNTGEYTWELDFNFMPDFLPGGASDLVGFVTPTDTVVNDFLQEGDIFTMDWTVSPHSEMEVIGAGAFRAIHLGLTLPPNQTESIRVIPAGEIWFAPDGTCRTDVTQFELIFHHLLSNGEEIRVASVGFQTTDTPGTLLGYFSASADGDVGTITGTFEGVNFSCTVNLDTYAVDCTAD